MSLVLLNKKEQVFKKYWQLPELRPLFAVHCELRSPFLVLTLRANPDAKHERVAGFKDLTVSERVSGKVVFTADTVFC